jgi:ADP-heptose:LPS heptosyltransferase
MKTALVARLGVIGDQLVASSILPGLKAQGYHVTFMAARPYSEIHRNNPHIDVLREVDEGALGRGQEFIEFWKRIGPAYDRVIHLSESIERTLVYFEDQCQFWWDETARRALSNASYLERTHDLAGVPHDFQPGFFPTEAEAAWAAEQVEGWGAQPLIGVVIAGSNLDKVYPKMGFVVAKLLSLFPRGRVLLFAGKSDRDRMLVETVLKVVHDAVPDGTARLKHAMGWSLRQALTMVQRLQLLIGPDTGLMWAAAMRPEIRKVVLLSHASPTNITKHWLNTATLHADPQEVPCWPCHRLHKRPETCRVQPDTGAAACIASISPETLMRVLTPSPVERSDHEQPERLRREAAA